MLIIRIQGGLGNQLSCYAFGRAAAKYLGVELQLDIEDYRSRKFEGGEPYFWPYFLDRFGVKEKVVSPEVVFAEDFKYLTDQTTVFRGGMWEALKEQFRPGVGLDGYGGDWRYHESVIDELREEIKPSETLSGRNREIYEEILGCESVGIHFRFGDYITNKDCFVLPLTYYQDALQVVGRSVDKPEVYIFTDSPGVIRSRLKLDIPYRLIEHNGTDGAVCDLGLLSACRHKILANSSFSFWAARLDGRKMGLTIVPDTYHNPHGTRMKEQFGFIPKPTYPPEWRPIHVRITEQYQKMLDERG